MVNPNHTPTRSVGPSRPHKTKWSIPTPPLQDQLVRLDPARPNDPSQPHPYKISWPVSTHQDHIVYPHSKPHKIKQLVPNPHPTQSIGPSNPHMPQDQIVFSQAHNPQEQMILSH